MEVDQQEVVVAAGSAEDGSVVVRGFAEHTEAEGHQEVLVDVLGCWCCAVGYHGEAGIVESGYACCVSFGYPHGVALNVASVIVFVPPRGLPSAKHQTVRQLPNHYSWGSEHPTLPHSQCADVA